MFSPRRIAQGIEAAERRLSSPGHLVTLREYSFGEVQAFVDRLSTAVDKNGAFTRALESDELAFVTNELALCSINFRYWAERYAMILGDKGKLQALYPLKGTQEKLLATWADLEEAGSPLRMGKFCLMLVKARQVGATALCEAAVAHWVMLHPYAKALIASNVPEKTLDLFQFQERILSNLPPWMKPQVKGQVKGDHLYFDLLDSKLMTGAGNQKDPMGQGVTLDMIHITEASTWPDTGCRMIDDDISPAFLQSGAPLSMFTLESTGAGAEGTWFFERYQGAKRGEGWRRALFLAWFWDASKIAPSEGVTFGETTLQAAERIKREVGLELSREQMAFYQLARQDAEVLGNLGGFLQEYPSSEEEAFQSGLESVFSVEVLDRVRNGLRKPIAVYEVDTHKRVFKETKDDIFAQEFSPDNRLIVWEAPRANATYVAGVDSSYGLESVGHDYGAIEVNRVGSRAEGDEQVAEWWGNFDAETLAIPVEMVGRLFRQAAPALLAIETNPGSPGLFTQNVLIEKNYPALYVDRYLNKIKNPQMNRFGWQTTLHTRPKLTGMGVDYVRKGNLKINSPFLLREMRSYVKYGLYQNIDLPKYSHAPGAHDDRLMALFIALYVSHEDDQINLAEERLREALKTPEQRVPVQFQQLPISWQDAVQQWEEAFL